MTKQEILQALSEKLEQKEITGDELINIIALHTQQPQITLQPQIKSEKTNKLNVTRMLYVLGAAIVIIGILIFVGQIWEDLGSLGRITITLLLGLIFAVSGSVLLKERPDENLGSVFHTIGGVLIPAGALVTLAELNTGSTSLAPVAMVFVVLTIFYLVLTTFHRNPILTFFTITNATAAIYITTQIILDSAYYYTEFNTYMNLTMVIGTSYLLLAHSFKNTWNHKLVGILHFFGILNLLGAAFSLVFDSGEWQLLYFPMLFAGFYLSVILRSKAILIISTLFLIAHVTYITGKYFADSIGWPISLVLLGLFLIGLGYGSITINKKYITTK